MPQVIGGNKIVFDKSDWLGGAVAQYGAGTDPVGEGVGGTLSEAQAFWPYRFMGYASPGYNAQDTTNQSSLASGLRKGVVDGANIYATGFTTDIAKISISALSPSVVDDATWPYTVVAHGGANTPVADDIVVYTHNVGSTPTRRIFYSWSDSVSWDVGNFNLTSTFDDDYMQTVPASPLAAPYTTGGQGKKHPMEIGEDDILYIADRQYVHALDGATGANGTFEAEDVAIPNGYEIRSLVKFPNYLVGFAYRPATTSGTSYYQGSTKAFFWDYLKEDPDYFFDLGDNYVGEAFIYNGTIGVFTQGRTNDLEGGGVRSSKMQLFRGFGTGFTEEVTFSGSIPERGGVWVNGGMIMWASDGKIMSYGAPYAGLPKALNSFAIGATSNTLNGMIINPTTSWYLLSPSSSSDARLKYFKSGNYADNTIVSTLNVTPNFSDEMIGEIKAVKVYFARASSAGRGLSIYLVNQAADSVAVLSNDGSAITSSSIVKEFKNPDKRMRFSGLKAYLQYSSGSGQGGAPIIDRIEVYFEQKNITKS